MASTLLFRPRRLNVLSRLFTERLTLRLSDVSEYGGIVGNGSGELDDIAGRGLIRENRRPLQFQVSLLPGTIDELGQVSGETAQVRAIGSKMKQFIEWEQFEYAEPLRIDALPTASFYRQVLSELLAIEPDSSFLSQLQATMHEQWQTNASAELADWLKVTLGITSGNKKRTLELEAKKDVFMAWWLVGLAPVNRNC